MIDHRLHSKTRDRLMNGRPVRDQIGALGGIWVSRPRPTQAVCRIRLRRALLEAGKMYLNNPKEI